MFPLLRNLVTATVSSQHIYCFIYLHVNKVMVLGQQIVEMKQGQDLAVLAEH